MSPEITNHQEPSRSTDGEGCQGEPSHRAPGFPHPDGVSEDDMARRAHRVSGEISVRGTAKGLNRRRKAATLRLCGRVEKSESSIVVSIQRRVQPLGSEGRALGSTRHETAKDWEMAGKQSQGCSTG